MKNIFVIGMSAVLVFSLWNISHAKNDKNKDLPPGLQKKVDRGQPLPPGWQKKLVVGDVLDKGIYDHGKIIGRDKKGHVTLRIENKFVRLIENTREIVEILDSM